MMLGGHVSTQKKCTSKRRTHSHTWIVVLLWISSLNQKLGDGRCWHREGKAIWIQKKNLNDWIVLLLSLPLGRFSFVRMLSLYEILPSNKIKKKRRDEVVNGSCADRQKKGSGGDGSVQMAQMKRSCGRWGAEESFLRGINGDTERERERERERTGWLVGLKAL